MPRPFRLILLFLCAGLLIGQAGCGVFKNGDCDCPAFSSAENQSSEQPLVPPAGEMAVNLLSETASLRP